MWDGLRAQAIGVVRSRTIGPMDDFLTTSLIVGSLGASNTRKPLLNTINFETEAETAEPE